MTHTTDLFVPPAAEGLPLAALDSATVGADRLDAAALTPTGRNFLAHALVQLARDGWLRTVAGEGFEPTRDRETPEPEAADAAVPVSPPADRTGLRDRIAAALAAADGWVWADGEPKEQSPIFQGYQRQAVAVLAVLPPPADRAAVPHDVELLHVVDAYLTATHAARHDVIGENGSCAGCQLQERVRAVLRRVAAEEQPTQTQVAEPETEEQIVRGHVLALHQIGEQLAGIESWMWERLADARDDERQQPAERPRCPHCQLPHDLTPSMALACASIRASIADMQRPVVGEQPDTQETP